MKREEDYKITGTCCLCGKEYTHLGNNPWPVSKVGRCCDECNNLKVIPARIANLQK